MSTEELTLTPEMLNAVVSPVARRLRSRYYGFVELEDVRQELLLWYIEHAEKVKEWYANHSPKTAERIFATALRNAGEKFCRREKATRSGYELDDEFFYSIQMCADILKVYFDPEWMIPSTSEQLGQTSSGKAANEGGNLLAMVADVGHAYEHLAVGDKFLLWQVYGGEWARDEREAKQFLAVEWECSYGAADKRVRRVLGRLRKKLGGVRPWAEKEDI